MSSQQQTAPYYETGTSTSQQRRCSSLLLWYADQHRLVVCYQCFGTTLVPSLRLKQSNNKMTGSVCSPETLVSNKIPEEQRLQLHHSSAELHQLNQSFIHSFVVHSFIQQQLHHHCDHSTVLPASLNML
jgi:hypothetical protein